MRSVNKHSGFQVRALRRRSWFSVSAMFARVAFACAWLAIVVLGAAVTAQEVLVDVAPDHHSEETETVKRKLSQLASQLDGIRDEVVLLYTEYTGQAGRDLKEFVQNITAFADQAVNAVGNRPDVVDHGDCRGLFEVRMKKIKLDALRAASFSGENHHKFLLGHMVVFRMHLNKSNEYIKKCDIALEHCGAICEEKPKIKRWKRLAAGEIHRIQADIQHTRKSYKDLVAHAKRRLIHLKKHLEAEAMDATMTYHECLMNKL